MDRQHSAPILLTEEGRSVDLELIPQRGPAAEMLEDEIQQLVHAHAAALPIAN
ncbi:MULTISPECIES: hypothetical protein [unclassified Bradyrhizobium]